MAKWNKGRMFRLGYAAAAGSAVAAALRRKRSRSGGGVRKKVATASGARTKKGRSYTRTKSKTRPRFTQDDEHSGLGSTGARIVLHKPLKIKGLGRWKFSQNYAGYISGNAGNQAVTVVMGSCMRNQFLTDTATPNALNIRRNLFDLNAERAITGSGIIPAQASPATDRIAVYHVRSNMMFTNLENVATTLVLYVLTPKRDTQNYADAAWADALGSESLTVASRTRVGGGLYGGTTAGGAFTTDLYQKPSDLRTFKDQYRILKTLRIKMSGASTEEVNLSIVVNKLVKRDNLNEISTDSLKGLSVEVLAVAYSQPVHDTGAANAMTTGSVRIGFVGTTTYTCGLTAAAAAARLDVMLTNQQIADAVALPAQQVMNVDDIIAPVIQA